jgi:small subunit ribosomal protein S8
VNLHKKNYKLILKYSENGSPVLAGLSRLSTPGRRLYVGSDELPRNNGGLGTVIVSTSRGLLSDSEARKRKLGGELICEVWS